MENIKKRQLSVRKKKKVLIKDNIFIKKQVYQNRYLLQPWQRLRSSKSEKEYTVLSYLKKMGVPCPQPLSYKDTRNFFGMLLESELRIEKINDAKDLRYLCLLDEHAEVIKNPKFRKGLIAEVAKWLRYKHECDVYHLNLNFRNIMVKVKPLFPIKIFFVDTTAAVIKPFALRVPYYQKKEIAFLYKDARKWFTTREMISFLHVYYGCKKLDKKQHRFIRRLVKYAQKKWGDRSSTL